MEQTDNKDMKKEETTPSTGASSASEPEKKVEVAPKFKEFISFLETLSLKDLSDLTKTIQDYFGIVPVAAAAAGSAEDSKEKKSENLDVILTEAGQSKIALIKALSSITGKGLMDAKKMIEKLPSTIFEKKPASEAENLKKQLEEAGATIELK
nr:50S ribosomal protein L7/L12-like [Lytechinus pictus]